MRASLRAIYIRWLERGTFDEPSGPGRHVVVGQKGWAYGFVFLVAVWHRDRPYDKTPGQPIFFLDELWRGALRRLMDSPPKSARGVFRTGTREAG